MLLNGGVRNAHGAVFLVSDDPRLFVGALSSDLLPVRFFGQRFKGFSQRRSAPILNKDEFLQTEGVN